jgi:hypothetical protein
MEAIYSSETSVDFQWNTRRYIPEDSTLNFKSSVPHREHIGSQVKEKFWNNLATLFTEAIAVYSESREITVWENLEFCI